ncbi:MAG: amidohydrolase [Sphingomonadales bacterium]|nr:MAG: amidohydrolase [Sphingomonadales bacterium]
MNVQAQIISPVKVKSPFGGRTVIDIDSHYSEPHDLWTKRAPAKFKDLVPRFATLDGNPHWIVGENTPLGYGVSAACTIRPDGSKVAGMECVNLGIGDVHMGSWDVASRLALMDQMGLSAQIIYPNILGFGGQAGAKVDPELRLISTQIFNDAMAEMQDESKQRIFPMALLPWWDRKLMIAETRRAHAMGLRGVNINPEPFEHKDADGNALPDLGNAHWDEFWAVCEELDLPINFHIGASDSNITWGYERAWASNSDNAKYIVTSTMLFLANAATMANLVFSGLLDRFPKLKFVSVESGLGWVPFFAEALNYQYAEAGANENLTKPPSQYLKDNIYTSFWFERNNLARDIRTVGVDNVMFETDFPHPTCLYPVDDMNVAFAGLEEAEIRKVLSGNAARVYNLPFG